MDRRMTGAALMLATLTTAAPALAETPSLIDPAWLADRLQNEDIAILDVRSPIDDGDATPFAEGHIPGAVDAGYTRHSWRSEQSGIIGKMPPVDALESLIGDFGVGNDDTVVIVPAGTGPTDFGSAARVYWTFQALGHDQVTILNGGYQAWLEADFDVVKGPETVASGDFEADLQTQMITTSADVENAEERGVQLIDARPSEYYEGNKKHPAARVAGTIPGAESVPHQSFFSNAETWRFDPERVDTALEGLSLSDGQRPVSFCNTGHWATTTWFALSEVRGIDNVGLYDGSMVEWTADESRPVAVAKQGLARILDFLGG